MMEEANGMAVLQARPLAVSMLYHSTTRASGVQHSREAPLPLHMHTERVLYVFGVRRILV